jgi:outer membrane protein
LLNDAQLNSSRASLEASRQLVPQARAGLRPSVSATGSIARNWVDTNVGGSGQYTSQSYGIGLNYPLYRPQNVSAFEQSKLQLEIAQASFGAAEQDLILRVAQAYFDVLAAADDLTTVQSEKKAIAEQLAAAKRNFEVGTATVTDQQEAQARFDLTLARELASENALAVLRCHNSLANRQSSWLNCGPASPSPIPNRRLSRSGPNAPGRPTTRSFRPITQPRLRAAK